MHGFESDTVDEVPAGRSHDTKPAWALVDGAGRCRWANTAAHRLWHEEGRPLLGRCVDEMASPRAGTAPHVSVFGVDDGLSLMMAPPLLDGQTTPEALLAVVESDPGPAGGEPATHELTSPERLAILLRHALGAPLSAGIAQLRVLERSTTGDARDCVARALRQISDLRGTLDTTVAIHYGGGITLRPAWIDFAQVAHDVLAEETANDPDIAQQLRWTRPNRGGGRMLGRWDPWALRHLVQALVSVALVPSRRDVVCIGVVRVSAGAFITVSGTHATWIEANEACGHASPLGHGEDTRLLLARRLSAAHGGNIEISGEVDGRAVAVVYLPEAI